MPEPGALLQGAERRRRNHTLLICTLLVVLCKLVVHYTRRRSERTSPSAVGREGSGPVWSGQILVNQLWAVPRASSAPPDAPGTTLEAHRLGTAPQPCLLGCFNWLGDDLFSMQQQAAVSAAVRDRRGPAPPPACRTRDEPMICSYVLARQRRPARGRGARRRRRRRRRAACARPGR